MDAKLLTKSLTLSAALLLSVGTAAGLAQQGDQKGLDRPPAAQKVEIREFEGSKVGGPGIKLIGIPGEHNEVVHDFQGANVGAGQGPGHRAPDTSVKKSAAPEEVAY